MQFYRSECSSERRVCITENDNQIRRFADQYLFCRGRDLPGLFAMAAGTDTKMKIGFRNLEFIEENCDISGS
jgi:hypothetical protein